MKIAPYLLSLSLLFFWCEEASAQVENFDAINVENNATIAGAAFFGRTQTDPLGNSILTYGMALSVSQTTEEVFGTYLTAAHYVDNWVTVEDWGWGYPNSYYEPHYEWQVVGQDYFPPVYDEYGNIVTEGYYQDRYDWVYTGEQWVSGPSEWMIVNSHQENQPIWVGETYEPYSEMRYNAPVIHQKATRSDANWVWEVPTAGGDACVGRGAGPTEGGRERGHGADAGLAALHDG